MTEAKMPALIPTREHPSGKPLALATWADLEAFAAATDTILGALARDSEKAATAIRETQAILGYFRPHDLADCTLATALARRSDGARTDSPATKRDLEKMLQARRAELANAQARIAAHNGLLIAAHQALAYWRPDDPPAMTYAQAVGRSAAGPAQPDNTPAPSVRRVTFERQGGTLVGATILDSPA